MKKLLSLLSVLTISGTAIPTTIAASPYQKEEKLNSDINYQQTNNLENLNRNKRSKINIIDENNSIFNRRKRTINKIINDKCNLCHNYLILQINSIDFQDIFFFKDTHSNNRDSLFNKIFRIINGFEKENSSYDNKLDDYISQKDIEIITNVVIDNFENIRNVFSKNPNKGLIIRTNRGSYWTNNDNWWGVHTDW